MEYLSESAILSPSKGNHITVLETLEGSEWENLNSRVAILSGGHSHNGGFRLPVG